MKPLFDNIKTGDYQSPIKKLNEYYKGLTDEYTAKVDNEDMLLYYLECRPKAIIIITTKNMEKDIPEGGLYKKTIKIETKEMWVNIKQQIVALEVWKGGCPKELYIYWLEEDRENLDGKKIIKNGSFEELVLYSRIFLNKNTIEFFRTSLPLNPTNCYVRWSEFVRKYRALPLIEQNNMVVFSGMVLYLNHIRTCTDIDILYLKELHLTGKYDKKEIEVGESWRLHLNGKMVKRGDVVVNPKYYQYFDGVKVVTMDVEMEIRGHRLNMPRAFVDMIMVNVKMDRKYKLPRIDIKTEGEREVFYKSMQNAFKKRYNREYSIENIKNLINKYK